MTYCSALTRVRGLEKEEIMSDTNHEELVALLKEQIKATNRATHALRAIVRPSTIMLVAFLVALPLAFIGFVSSDLYGLVIVAALVILGSAIGAISSQISETKQSEIPITLEDSNSKLTS